MQVSLKWVKIWLQPKIIPKGIVNLVFIGPSCTRLALKVKDLGQIGRITSALNLVILPNIPNDMLYPAGAFMPLPLNTFAPSGTTKR